MTKMNTRIHCALVTTLAVAVAGCGGSGSGVGVPDSNGMATGIISFAVSDHPMHDAEKVCITFDQIEFKGEGPSTVVNLDPAEKVNLLEFQGMNAQPILSNHELPSGQYEWVRLGVDAVRGSNGGLGDTGGVDCDGEASYVVMNDGGVHNLYVPSSANTGLKLVGGFTVPENGFANLIAEIDLAKSLNAPPGQDPDMKMRPTIRLINNAEAGALTGQVANELATAEACEPSVYVFNDGVTPNAIDDGDVADPNDPVATAMVNERTNNDVMEYHYTVGYLSPGEYEAAFTCDGTEFEPPEGKPASIFVGEVTIVDFLVPPETG